MGLRGVSVLGFFWALTLGRSLGHRALRVQGLVFKDALEVWAREGFRVLRVLAGVRFKGFGLECMGLGFKA